MGVAGTSVIPALKGGGRRVRTSKAVSAMPKVEAGMDRKKILRINQQTKP